MGLEEHATAFAFVEGEISRTAKYEQLEVGRVDIVGAVDSISPDCVERQIRRRLAQVDDVCPGNPKDLFDVNGESDNPVDIVVGLVRRKDSEVEIRIGSWRSGFFAPKARSDLTRSAAECENGDEVVRPAEIGECRSEVGGRCVRWFF